MLEDNEEIQVRPTLQKGNIILRAPQPSDLQELRAFVQYPEISRMYGRTVKEEQPITEEAALNWYRQMCCDPLRWFIEVDGRLAGTTGFHTFIKDDRKARFVIGLFHPGLLNRGTGTIATRLLLQQAFEQMSLHRVDLRVLAFNERAIAAYRKCGFRPEGVERESAWIDGKWYNDIMMSILEHEYRALMPDWGL